MWTVFQSILKNKMIFFLIIYFTIWFDCFAENSNKIIDSIKILEVIPNSELIDGTETNITVKVAYTLVSSDYAELQIGFNTETPYDKKYRLIDSAAKVIQKGSGEYIFSVKVVPIDWTNYGDYGNFFVAVNLSPYPHDSSWVAYGFDEKVLQFKKDLSR